MLVEVSLVTTRLLHEKESVHGHFGDFFAEAFLRFFPNRLHLTTS